MDEFAITSEDLGDLQSIELRQEGNGKDANTSCAAALICFLPGAAFCRGDFPPLVFRSSAWSSFAQTFLHKSSELSITISPSSLP